MAGIKLRKKAWRETDEERVVYWIEGKVGKEEYGLAITADGEVIEVEGPERDEEDGGAEAPMQEAPADEPAEF